ncbi:MAG TPA: electron transfer flavoprotein subunit alpha/FixB family protein [Ktedonosporobacter sp.]|jgi:electron transfer flavoprotein alpha subunit|nr:electron transfer flavoprotein subunit alpha/FixB family protein [Ktedonosporobacter sp.]
MLFFAVAEVKIPCGMMGKIVIFLDEVVFLMSEIWAVLEYTEAELHEQSGELLGEVAAIAERQQEPATFCAVLLVAPDTKFPDISLLAAPGVQRVYLLEHPQLAFYSTEAYVTTLSQLIQLHSPKLVVTGATPNGRDWAPRLAAQLHLPFVSGCASLDLQHDAMLALRVLYEGRAYAQTRTALHGDTALATLSLGGRGIPTGREGLPSAPPMEIIHMTPEIKPAREQERIRRTAIKAPSPEAVELDAAERIVAGGHGVGQEGFTTIAAFAHQVSAAVGATRVATDLGWIEHARQIGATGKIVRPKLYIACGISGAAQHTSGMSESQTVVAINPDRTAPIFALADLGLLGDANQILSLATKMLNNTSS